MSTNDTKWTPGPWTVFDGSPQIGDHTYRPGIDAGNLSIVLFGIVEEEDEAGIRGGTAEEALANARLIAAAPELYSALYQVLTVANLHDHPAISAMARAALAKARGEST